MTKDPSLLAKEFVDAAVLRQGRRGRLAKANRTAYQRAIKTATVAIRELASISGATNKAQQPRSNGGRPTD